MVRGIGGLRRLTFLLGGKTEVNELKFVVDRHDLKGNCSTTTDSSTTPCTVRDLERKVVLRNTGDMVIRIERIYMQSEHESGQKDPCVGFLCWFLSQGSSKVSSFPSSSSFAAAEYKGFRVESVEEDFNLPLVLEPNEDISLHLTFRASCPAFDNEKIILKFGNLPFNLFLISSVSDKVCTTLKSIETTELGLSFYVSGFILFLALVSSGIYLFGMRIKYLQQQSSAVMMDHPKVDDIVPLETKKVKPKSKSKSEHKIRCDEKPESVADVDERHEKKKAKKRKKKKKDSIEHSNSKKYAKFKIQSSSSVENHESEFVREIEKNDDVMEENKVITKTSKDFKVKEEKKPSLVDVLLLGKHNESFTPSRLADLQLEKENKVKPWRLPVGSPKNRRRSDSFDFLSNQHSPSSFMSNSPGRNQSNEDKNGWTPWQRRTSSENSPTSRLGLDLLLTTPPKNQQNDQSLSGGKSTPFSTAKQLLPQNLFDEDGLPSTSYDSSSRTTTNGIFVRSMNSTMHSDAPPGFSPSRSCETNLPDPPRRFASKTFFGKGNFFSESDFVGGEAIGGDDDDEDEGLVVE